MKKQTIMIVLAMSLALVNYSPVYAEESNTSFVNGYEEEVQEPLEIIGAKDFIYVDKGDKIDILKDVTTNREATLTVSDYDENLTNKNQVVTITATDEDGNTTYKEVVLRIRWFKVKTIKKVVYATITTNVRAKPTSKSKKIGTVRFNQKIRVTGKVYSNGLDQKDSSNKWYRIKYKGKTGYITTKWSVNKRIKKGSSQYHVVELNRSAVASGWWSRDGDHIDSKVWDKAVQEAAEKEK